MEKIFRPFKPRRTERNSNADADEDFVTVDIERVFQQLHQPFRHAKGIACAANIVQQDDELVSAKTRKSLFFRKTGDPIGAAEFAFHTAHEFDEQLIANRVPKVVIDELETIHIQEQHCEEQVWTAL